MAPAMVAEYQTLLPGKALLKRKLLEFYEAQQSDGGNPTT
jgi:hypothetical protein